MNTEKCCRDTAHFSGGGSVVVNSLFVVAPIVCGEFVFGPCVLMQHLVSFLVLHLSLQGRESRLLCCYAIVAVTRAVQI